MSIKDLFRWFQRFSVGDGSLHVNAQQMTRKPRDGRADGNVQWCVTLSKNRRIERYVKF